jgi:hypothetical protein
MFKITKKDKRTKLEKEIDSVLEQMSAWTPDTEEYSAMSVNLEQLYKARAQERIHHISPDTIAVVAGNLLGIVLILNFEKTDIIRTKALGFILKGRV